MNKFLAFLTSIGTALLTILSIFYIGKIRGKEEEELEQLKKSQEQANAIKKQNDTLDRLSDSDVRNRLRKEFTRD